MLRVSASGPNRSRQGIVAYDIVWPSLSMAASRPDIAEERSDEGWVWDMAFLGSAAMFFGNLRADFPKAFMLTNMDASVDSVNFVGSHLNLSHDLVRSTYRSIDVSWDYGWGRGGLPIRDSPSRILELEDLTPFLRGLVGMGPAEMSFVLLLAERGVELADVARTIEGVQSTEDWEAEVLNRVALLGFPHETASYTVKTKHPEATRSLSDLARQRPFVQP